MNSRGLIASHRGFEAKAMLASQSGSTEGARRS